VVWQFCPESVENVGRGVMAEKVGAGLPAKIKAGGLVEKLLRSISLHIELQRG